MPMSSQAARALREAQRQARPARKPHFDEGYLKTATAAIWQGPPAYPVDRPSTHIRWSKKALWRPEGSYQAIARNVHGELLVCLAAVGPREWKQWKEVQFVPGIKEWLRTGF